MGVPPHSRALILMLWSAMVMRLGLLKCKAANNVCESITDEFGESRVLLQQIIDLRNLPMPFQYFHLLKAMTVICLLLWAIKMGHTSSIFAPLVYFFSMLVLMGLSE